MKKNSSAFTLIELLVVIAIIAVLATFAVPAITGALTKGQMTGTLNNARQLYLAGFQMANDGATNSDANLAWPGADPRPADLQDYCTRLVTNGYLNASDLSKLLSAPGAVCSATSTVVGDVTNVRLDGASSLKVYPVKETDASNVIFATTSNYVYNTAFTATAPAPYGDKGFVVIRKGGDASVLRKNNAKAAAGPSGIAAFESTVGKKPDEAAGTVTAGDPQPGLLKFP
jgi:prepilin-type N-terminal cleavage/methylation domain-containing protein